MDLVRPLPFLLNTENEITKFRSETFWTKEPETIQWIDFNLSTTFSCDTFVDVGANIGIYSLYAALSNRVISIIAVEPIGLNFRELETNIELNKFSDRINAVHVALSNSSGIGTMDVRDERIGSSGAQLNKSKQTRAGEIQFLTGDQLLCDHSIKSRSESKRIMLKIDTDGNELDVLNGFIETFSERKIHTVLCETHPSNIEGIDSMMHSLNFVEDLNYLMIPDHSNHRRIAKGSSERTKIYSLRN